MSVKHHSLGGAEIVTGSKIPGTARRCLLVGCGSFQATNSCALRNRTPRLIEPEKIDAVIDTRTFTQRVPGLAGQGRMFRASASDPRHTRLMPNIRKAGVSDSPMAVHTTHLFDKHPGEHRLCAKENPRTDPRCRDGEQHRGVAPGQPP
jgi:hypothetical protein